MKKTTLFLILTCLLSSWGCGKGPPSGFPQIHPMTVTVKNGDTPLPDVKVAFLPVTGGVGYGIAGTTDPNGVTQVRTTQGDYGANGIPQGEFVVTVQDVVKIDLGVTPEEAAKMSLADQNKLSLERRKLTAEFPRKVPPVLCRNGVIANRSPIRFTAKPETNELTIDVSQYEK